MEENLSVLIAALEGKLRKKRGSSDGDEGIFLADFLLPKKRSLLNQPRASQFGVVAFQSFASTTS